MIRQAEQRSLLAPRRITGPNFRKELAFVRTLAVCNPP